MEKLAPKNPGYIASEVRFLKSITQRMVNLGLVKMEMRRASKRISEAVPI